PQLFGSTVPVALHGHQLEQLRTQVSIRRLATYLPLDRFQVLGQAAFAQRNCGFGHDKAPRKETKSRRAAPGARNNSPWEPRAARREDQRTGLAHFLVLLDIPGDQAFRALAALLRLLPVLL